MDTRTRLEELRTILRSETISYDELHELQDLGARGHIEPGDVELLEAAGVPEQQDSRRWTRAEGFSSNPPTDKRTLQIVHEFDHEPTYIVTCDDDHEDIATVEPSTPNAVEVADELVRRWNSHNDLLAALKAFADNVSDDEDDYPDYEAYKQAKRLEEQARAAIKNATNTH